MMKEFSDRENKIIKILGRRKMTVKDISERLWLTDDEPFNSNIFVSNCIGVIIKKCAHHKLKWTLEKTRRNGTLFIKRETI